MEPKNRKSGATNSNRHYEPCELKLYLQKKLHRSTLELIKNHLRDCVICSDRLGFVQAGQEFLIKQREAVVKKQEETGKMGDETLELWDKLSEALKEAEKELNQLVGFAVWDWRSSNGLLSVKILNFRLLFISGELGLENMSFYFRSHGNPREKLVFSPRKTGGGVAAGSVDYRFQGGASLSIL